MTDTFQSEIGVCICAKTTKMPTVETSGYKVVWTVCVECSLTPNESSHGEDRRKHWDMLSKQEAMCASSKHSTIIHNF